MSIPIEGIAPQTIAQVYVRDNSDPLNVYFYGYVINNSRKLMNKKWRITRLRLNFSIKVARPCKLQVISIKRKIGDGLKMWFLTHYEGHGEDILGVQNEDFNFLNLAMSRKEKVVYEKDLQVGINHGFVSMETQKFYDYGPEAMPLSMLVAMITSADGKPCRMDFTIDRKIEYIVD